MGYVGAIGQQGYTGNEKYKQTNVYSIGNEGAQGHPAPSIHENIDCVNFYIGGIRNDFECGRYDSLINKLAKSLPEKDLENTDSLKKILHNEISFFAYEDWFELLIAVRHEKHQAEYEKQTAEKIRNEMQFPTKAAANEAVNQLLQAANKGQLYGFDIGTKNTVLILWKIFYCCISDIKDSIRKVNMTAKLVSETEEREHKKLLFFIEALREKIWERGEVLKLREIE